MLSSTVLDVAIGLIFTFLAFSLAVSAIVEAIASFFKWRSGTLLQGMKDLLNDQDLKGLVLNLYNHALINPRQSGKAQNMAELVAGGLWPASVRSQLPAYINSDQFAAAMTDVLKLGGGDPAALKLAISNNALVKDDEQLKTLLDGIVDRAGGDIEKVRKELAGWFDNAMDRVGGAYKRRTQLWGFIIALVMAGLLNVSAINIGQALWRRPMMAKAIGPQTNLTTKNVIDQLNALQALDVPIGWNTPIGNNESLLKPASAAAGFYLMLFAGWIITAIATLFGAPFWFDSLQQIIRLKGAGPSPAEKAEKTAASG
jgi:hypothetical protein